MKKRSLFGLTLSLFICMFAAGQPAKHVVIITIDGFRPDFYLDESWGAVNLRQLMNEGVYARGVNGIFPTVTFPSHTTIISGVRPVTHGIFYNDPFEPNVKTGRWYWEYKAIKCPTLWTAAQKAGLSTAAVLWPVTVGAPIDYNIPDVWPVGKSDRLQETSRYASPKGLFEELEENATGKLEANDFNLEKDYLAMDDNVARMAAYLIRKHKPDLIAVHLPAVDHAEHAQGRDGEQVRRAVAGADRSIRTIIEAVDKAGIKDSTAIIITGDHGFVNKHTYLHPNILLSKAGLMEDTEHDKWKAQFKVSGGSSFLYLKNKDDKKTLEQVRLLLAALPASQKKFFHVIDGQELRQSGADTNAVLALAAIRGIAFGGSVKGELLTPAHGGGHGYFPDFAEIQTGFIGYGAGFKKGTVIPVMDLTDIAPIIAKLLGIDLPSATGVLYPGILSE